LKARNPPVRYGQKRSFDKAKSINDKTSVSPTAMRMRSALSLGGRPVTA